MSRHRYVKIVINNHIGGGNRAHIAYPHHVFQLAGGNDLTAAHPNAHT